MNIAALHHAQITITPGGEERARHFYCGLLGLPEIDKPGVLRDRGGFWLQVGAQELHVSIEESGVDRRATKAHLAYLVDDLATLETVLHDAGIETDHDVALAGYVRCHCRDPFGNRVEFVQRI